MNSVLLQGPRTEPVSRAELRSHLHLDASQDGLLGSFIAAARMTIEAQSGLRLIDQDWRVFLDDCSVMPVALPVPPVRRIKAVKQTGHVLRVLAATEYRLLADNRLEILSLDRRSNAPSFEVDLMAGFGAAETDVPADLRLAVKSLAAHWYDIDDWNQLSGARAIPAHVLSIVDQHRNLRLS